MPKRDPDITDLDDLAIGVPCNYCGAKDGEPCRVSKDGPQEIITLSPHRRRVQAMWDEQERNGD